MPKIVFTGGGTAGHVTPNLPIIEALQHEAWSIDYIGSTQSVEQEMMKSLSIPFHSVRSGKLRRYFSFKNFVDIFNTLISIVQSAWLLRKLKADIVFSKGGFVAFPVVVGAWLNKIPVIAHESDLTPGLANRLSFPFVDTLCLTFAPAAKHFKYKNKIAVTGTPIRLSLLQGDKTTGLALCGFTTDKPCLLVMGGSQGSSVLNHCVREALDALRQEYQVIHICGAGKVDSSYLDTPGYYQFEYVNESLAHLYAAADCMVSRAGANSLYELLALKKPHVLVPLSRKGSRGDQINNADYFAKQGISQVIYEEQLTVDSLLNALHVVIDSREEIIRKIESLDIRSATDTIVGLIKSRV